MTLMYKGYTFDEMVAAIKKCEELEDTLFELGEACKRTIIDLRYWEEKYEEVCEDYKLLEKANESLRKKNKKLQTDYNKLEAKFDSSEIKDAWNRLEERRKLLNDVINSVIRYCEDEEGMI